MKTVFALIAAIAVANASYMPMGARQVTAIADGQPQAQGPSAAVNQITDGQVQGATAVAAPVTQITDGQVQAQTPVASPYAAPSPPAAPVTQITDGQVQAPTAVSPVTQITDGQVQAPTPGAYSPPAPVYTGAAVAPVAGFGGVLAAGVAAVALL